MKQILLSISELRKQTKNAKQLHFMEQFIENETNFAEYQQVTSFISFFHFFISPFATISISLFHLPYR